MYQILDLKRLISLFAVIALVAGFVGVYVAPPSDIQGFVHLASGATTVTVLVIIVVGETPLFHFIWRQNIVQKLFFPYLHGRWEGTIRSNWEVIRKIREYAGAGGAAALDEMNTDKLGYCEKEVVVEIKASFLRVSMKLIPRDGYSDSFTVALKPVAEGERGRPCLYYVYRANVKANVSTDSNWHYGAAWMDVKSEEGILSLHGVYWTDREWTRGMNTAGILEARKVA
jgi:hypothetical protein